MLKQWGKDSILLLGLSALLVACVSFYKADRVYNYRTLEEIRTSGKLVVLTLNAPTMYFFNRDGRPSGPEYQLAKAFAKSLSAKGTENRAEQKVVAEFKVMDNLSELLDALKEGQGDLAAAGLSITEKRKQHFLFGPVYKEVAQQVVCRLNGARPRSVEQLQNHELLVLAGSSYEERLQEYQQEYPELHWQTTVTDTSEQILDKVWRKQAACTVLDASIVALNRRYFPEIRVRFELGEPQSLAWAYPPGATELIKANTDWLAQYRSKGKLATIDERYYGHVDMFDYVDTAALIRRIKSRYQTYRPLFLQAAEAYGVDEVLLAAQSYQESHWNPRARSPTGVRGMMMLTWPTAKQLGVKQRLNPAQSIDAGARYLVKLKATMAKDIPEPDLTWFALAAYNVGLGHLRDAQQLAEEMGKDPNKWLDMKTVLPLLSNPKYYKKLRYGYARGSEPVTYVQQIREYEHILLQRLPPVETSLALSDELDSSVEAN